MKYSLVFTKLGYLRFISHLDMIRLFKRAFKRADILLKFSEGFNPHPKMVFAQPLSLGYGSISEVLDIETKIFYDEKDVMKKLNEVLPEDIRIVSCEEKEESYKGMASKIIEAEYIIEIDHINLDEDVLRKYLEQKEIISYKKQKKKKELKEVDIKPMIIQMSKLEKDEINEAGYDRYYEESTIIKSKLACGSTSNLSPELVISTFIEHLKNFNIELDRIDFEVTRLALK